jgi:hypothetical protein
MKIDAIKTTQTNIIKNSKKIPITKSIEKNSAKNISINMGIAAASGMYVANKALKEKQDKIEILQKDLEFNEETINKVLNAKNEKGKPLFNKKNISILKETKNFENGIFFNHIMKNIDGIDYISKTIMPDFTYEMHSDNHKGKETYAKMYVDFDNTSIDISEKDGNIITYHSYTIDEDEISESITVLKDEKLLKDEDIVYNKKTNTITRSQNNEKHQVISSNKIAFYPNGVIKNTTAEKYNYNDNEIKRNTINIDYEHNATIKAIRGQDYDNMHYQIKTYLNPKTGRKETLKLERSEVSEIYNSTIIDDKGNIKKEIIGKKDNNGNVSVEKNLESLDGTKTYYKYNSSADGNNIKMHYQIKDSKGQPLTTVDRTFNRISPNLAYSSVNGHNYKIEKKRGSIIVTDNTNGEVTKIPYSEIFANKKSSQHKDFLDKMSGDMLIDFYNKEYKYLYTNDELHSYTYTDKNIIETKDNMFIFAHEQGHSKDTEIIEVMTPEKFALNTEEEYELTSNPTFLQTFNEERLAFVQAFPDLEQEYIKYFIEKLNHESGNLGGARETLAESNALLSIGLGHKDIAVRDYYLQKYFPRTIAVASKILNPILYPKAN